MIDYSLSILLVCSATLLAVLFGYRSHRKDMVAVLTCLRFIAANTDTELPLSPTIYRPGKKEKQHGVSEPIGRKWEDEMLPQLLESEEGIFVDDPTDEEIDLRMRIEKYGQEDPVARDYLWRKAKAEDFKKSLKASGRDGA
uniref:Uncharacterized protein n=1 Tax=viral metagenome TaxID=1070528 RepID=A0A6H1ZVY9_9ZZZZ